MSNPTTPTDNPVITLADSSEETEKSVEKVPFIQKAKTFVKNHKKSTIAVGALAGLVGLAAVTGRKSDPLPGFEATLALEPPHASFDVDVVEAEDDTVTA
jgi:hypothetical protein